MPPSQYPNQYQGQMPNPIATDQPSGFNKLWIVVGVLGLFFIGSVAFGIWAFMGRQNYKNNVNQKISAAVQQNTQKVQKADAANYAEQAKNPLKTYEGPPAYGSIVVKYPKTWSAYVDTSNTSTPVDAYFQPDFVPSTDQNSGNNFALRLQVLNQSYDQALSTYSSQVQQGSVKITSYKPANVPSDPGVMVTGAIQQNKQGVMIILPLRANTLELWTESDQQDFAKYILPNFSFSP